ncbi:MAG: hypothetical protein HFH47_00185 [Bacilli bacterium]|nr:hypothetical protein [Bacilli bacterium]
MELSSHQSSDYVRKKKKGCENMNLEEQKKTGVNQIHVIDSLNASLLEVKIKNNETTVVPDTNDLFIYVDKTFKDTVSETRKQYLFNLNSSLKSVGEVSDEFQLGIEIQNNEAIIKAFVKRMIGVSAEGNYVLDTPVIEELEAYPLILFEGENYIYTNYDNANIEIIYPKDNEFNRMYLSNAIYCGHSLNSMDDFSLDDIYFKDAFTKTEDKLNLEIDNANISCLTSKNNKFSLDEEGNLIVNSIMFNKPTDNVVGEIILENNAPIMKIDNLDALNDGGVYEFLVIGYANSTTVTDIKVKINEQTSGYHHSYINASGTLSSSGSLTSRATYVQNVDDINEYLQTSGNNNAFPVIIEGRLYISENSSGQKKVNYTLRFFKSVSAGQSVWFGGGVFAQNFENINSLSLSLVNTNVQFAKGSRLTVFNPLKGLQGAKGEKGEKGETGATGEAGPSNTLIVGTVTSGDTASATITGESPNQTLNLVLPKGDTGETGATGETGPSNTLTIGTVASGDTASATITGESPNQTLNLVLPKGEKGEAGGTMTESDIQDIIDRKLGIVYPVGSIYMSVIDTEPSILFGGTWEQLKDKFLLGAGDNYIAGTTGGSTELQEHSHSIPALTGSAASNGNHTHTLGADLDVTYTTKNPGSFSMHNSSPSGAQRAFYTGNQGAHTHNVTTNASTTGNTGNGTEGNMPPYLTVYMWKRVS